MIAEVFAALVEWKTAREAFVDALYVHQSIPHEEECKATQKRYQAADAKLLQLAKDIKEQTSLGDK
jgi:hypothetical protein